MLDKSPMQLLLGSKCSIPVRGNPSEPPSTVFQRTRSFGCSSTHWSLFSATPGLVYNFRDVPDVNMVGVGLICLGSTLIANLLMKNNNMLGLSKSKPGSTAPVYFSDIFGNDDIKEKLGEFIDYLKNPKKYQEIGARTRKGILLYGPPGTGKTMIAKATACESGVRFLYCSAAEFQ